MSDSGRHRSPVSPGDVVGGKYRVEQVLGAGGMGVVVSAMHIELGQFVALKFVLPSALSGAGALERFMREARAAVRLRSEHVCRVLDVGRDGARPYMVLELLEGMDLAKLAQQHGSLPVADTVEYVLQACDALVEAHALGIVHRDLKPQNLFVTRRRNGTPLVKVLDFGIAKSVGPAAVGQMALTDSAAIIGSPLYMAPEQMRSPKTVDVRIDIWALGVILYELLGGRLPFDGDTVTEVCIKVVNEEPTRLLDLRPALDRKLVDVVMRCLEKDPEDRFQNVAQLATELEPFSRSGLRGSLVRPWRSFEETQQGQGAGGQVQVPLAPTPDDTGPSTAVTMPSMPPDVLAANAAAGAAPQMPVPVSVRRTGDATPMARIASTPAPGAPPSRPPSLPDAGSPLASTETTWGEGTSRRPPVPQKSFATGLAAGLAASVVAAGLAAAFVLRAGGPPAASAGHASAAPPPAQSAPPPAEAPSPAPEAPAPVAPEDRAPPAPVSVAGSAAPAPSSPAGAPRTVRSVPGGKRAPASPAPATSTQASAPAASSRPAETRPADAPPVRPAEPLAPNGAPILR